MQVERHRQPVQSRPQPGEPLLVEVTRVGTVVDQRAAESELPDAALQFAHCRVWVLQRERGESAEPGWVRFDRPGQVVVGEPGVVRSRGGVQWDLHPGHGEGHHLDVDAVVVHLPETLGGEVG